MYREGNKIIINIPDDVVSKIERYQYELEARKDIIVTMLSTQSDVAILEGEVFKHYEKLYETSQVEYNLTKSAIEDAWVPAELKGHNIDWNLDFRTNQLTITVKCDCGLEIIEGFEYEQ